MIVLPKLFKSNSNHTVNYKQPIVDALKTAENRNNEIKTILGDNYTMKKEDLSFASYADTEYTYSTQKPKDCNINMVATSVSFSKMSQNYIEQSMRIYLRGIPPGGILILDDNFKKLINFFDSKLDADNISVQMKKAVSDYYEIKKTTKTFSADDMTITIEVEPLKNGLFLNLFIFDRKEID